MLIWTLGHWRSAADKASQPVAGNTPGPDVEKGEARAGPDAFADVAEQLDLPGDLLEPEDLLLQAPLPLPHSAHVGADPLQLLVGSLEVEAAQAVDVEPAAARGIDPHQVEQRLDALAGLGDARGRYRLPDAAERRSVLAGDLGGADHVHRPQAQQLPGDGLQVAVEHDADQLSHSVREHHSTPLIRSCETP